ncbi:NAD(+)/NADH kinase [Eubacterium sp. AB3007]|uniref:NAD(+)/NADH kinase n=1 Tax=Eubacterium sp. AB3007 TaxID=1392487 RepID=UPI00048282C6|nr:NAD(+)/NADH kinase [Eubacterium sp. AB3007]
MRKHLCIYTNGSNSSLKTERVLKSKLSNSACQVLDGIDRNADIIVCIGGDGTFLEVLHKYDFPEIPMVGINTGHLGFFQEIMPDQLDDLIFNLSHDRYSLQPLSTVRINVECDSGCHEHIGLNEVCVKGDNSHSVHLNMSIGGSFIERFSGDGLVVATPAGSTAYNYSLGGSIVDPRLTVLQVTPIAPMNTIAYRSFTSSVLLPSDLELGLIPDIDTQTEISIVCDGYTSNYAKVKEMTIGFSDKKVNLVRFEGYDFWTKVKSKFL